MIVRADSAYYTADMAATARRAGAKFSITVNATSQFQEHQVTRSHHGLHLDALLR